MTKFYQRSTYRPRGQPSGRGPWNLTSQRISGKGQRWEKRHPGDSTGWRQGSNFSAEKMITKTQYTRALVFSLIDVSYAYRNNFEVSASVELILSKPQPKTSPLYTENNFPELFASKAEGNHCWVTRRRRGGRDRTSGRTPMQPRIQVNATPAALLEKLESLACPGMKGSRSIQER